ncbi:MAG: ABC transporter permease [Thermoleophilaceae bacterium]
MSAPAPAPAAAAGPALVEMTGPSATSGDWGRFYHLTRTLAVTDFKVRFYDSALGYLWTLMKPLMFFGVLYVVFSLIVKVGEGVDHYPAMLVSGIVLFFFFSESTGKGVTSVVDSENLVRKIHFPRMVIPLSGVLTNGFFLLLNLVAVMFFFAVDRVEVRLTWLELPVLLALLFLFTIGVTMVLSVLYVPARDVKPIWEVGSQALFYLTPVLYPISLVAEKNEQLANLAMCNPLAAIIQQSRHALIDPDQPSAAAAIGGAPRLLIPLGILVGTFLFGLWLFNRMAPRIAEEL